MNRAELNSAIHCLPGFDPDREADGFEFDYDKALLACKFFPECLKFTEGVTRGKPFILQPWQAGIVGNLFGWYQKKRGIRLRRFQEMLLLVPRINGKSPLASGTSTYLLFGSPYHNATIWFSAADTKQAGILYKHAKGMIEAEPSLRRRAQIYKGYTHKQIINIRTNSLMEVISSTPETKHGTKLLGALLDEYHTFKTDEVISTIRTAMGSMSFPDPLLAYLTTIDFEGASPCNDIMEYAFRVRDGVVDDPRFLPVLYVPKKDDDWADRELWRRVNPNLGISKDESVMEKEFKRAIDQASNEFEFKRLHLNMQTQAENKWLDVTKWRACRGEFDVADFKNVPCHIGVDLSARGDLTAMAVVWRKDDKFFCKAKYWLPSDVVRQKESRGEAPYQLWHRQGWIEFTSGDRVDQEEVANEVIRWRNNMRLRRVVYDRISEQDEFSKLLMAANIEVLWFGQGFLSLSGPSKNLEDVISKRAIVHDGNPILLWNVECATIKQDPAGNIKPVKPDRMKSRNRIDGLVALIMALGSAIEAGKPRSSVYETRGIITL